MATGRLNPSAGGSGMGSACVGVYYSYSGLSLSCQLQGYWTSKLGTLTYLTGKNYSSNTGSVTIYLNGSAIYSLSGYQYQYKSRCAYMGDNSTPSTWRDFNAGEAYYGQGTVSASGTMHYGSNTLRLVYSNMRFTAKSTTYYNNLASCDVSTTITIATPTYAISYNANGHGTAPAGQTKTYGVNLTLQPFIGDQSSSTTASVTITGNANEMTWSGSNGSAGVTTTTAFHQTYWNTNSSGTGTNYGSQGTYSQNAAATLYAIWSSSNTKSGYSYTLPTGTPTKAASTTGSLTVSYNANGGSSTPSSQTSTKPVTYTFSGWYTAASGGTQRTTSSRVIAAETVYAQYSTSVGNQGAVTLAAAITKANSTADGYTVSYNANGGTSTPSSQTATDTISYAFNGWHAGSASGTTYTAGASFTPTANTTMYAGWTSTTTRGSVTLASAISKSNTTTTGYTVTFNPNTGATTKTSQTATRTLKWTFNKWAAGSTSGTGYNAGASFQVTANTTMYATWNSSTYSEGSVTLPTAAECTKSGYELLGWSTSSTATTATYAPGASYSPTAAITLYAVWKALGLVYIDNGTSFDAYMIYIDNGTSWDQYCPYIDNGSSWDMYS